MIIVQLQGGFGNQLFQYAAAMALAVHHNCSLKVDPTLLGQPDKAIGTFRNYNLQVLEDNPIIAELDEINRVKGSKLSQYLYKLLPPYRRNVYRELGFEFDPNFYKSKIPVYLKGYRQSEAYFVRYKTEVLSKIRLQNSYTEPLQNWVQKLQEGNSVAVHIRRGDYKNPVVTNYHGILTLDYYKAAINYILNLYPNSDFYVFSDTPEVINELLDLNISVKTVQLNSATTQYDDFYLMSCCKHNIIANSSFSWWAAYLNHNPKKTVIAPKQWFNKAPYNTKDLYPTDWIQL
jgi:hypothetical protein